MELNVKTCPRCKKELPVTEFSKNNKNKDGFYTYCKKCKNELNKEYRLKRTPPPKSDIKAMTPREIIQEIRVRIEELRTRGYNFEGKLTYLQEIRL